MYPHVCGHAYMHTYHTYATERTGPCEHEREEG